MFAVHAFLVVAVLVVPFLALAVIVRNTLFAGPFGVVAGGRVATAFTVIVTFLTRVGAAIAVRRSATTRGARRTGIQVQAVIARSAIGVFFAYDASIFC